MHASPFAFDSSPTPYETGRTARGMQYVEAYMYYFHNPNWLINLLLVTVCQLIPFVGMIVLLGYEYELILFKHRRNAQSYPDFDFGRFTDYLTRGIWPFLVFLILGLVMTPVALILWFGTIILFGVLGSQANGSPAIALVVLPLMFLVFAVIQVAIVVVTTPMALKAGLSKDIGQAFDLAFVKDFIHRVGWETILANLFLMLTGWLAMLLGMLACFIGMYPALAVVQLANTHLMWQLYELYLARGGMPIALAEDDVIQAERA